MADIDKSVIIVVCSTFQNEETDESECFNIVVKFRDRKQFDMIEGDGFDNILENLTEAIQNKYGGNWFIDDVVEINREGKEDDIVDLDLTNFKI